ncbi:MAG: dihydrolipoyl dehydrogenase [Desulfovibrio sp.]|jgi:dihydrolipoamide dehydrogenase|nr:dihydrolipoyl dehydrogenase [Desulfovibrio sp.]
MPDGQMPHIIIVGAGPGGYAAAFHAARSGARVTLVEKNRMGGTCLHAGCIPTKTIQASARALETAGRLAEFGIVAGNAPAFAVDMAAVMARKEKVRTILRTGLEKTCAGLKVRLVRGRAELLAGPNVLVRTAGGTEPLSGAAVVLATGSRTLNLPALPVDHKRILDSDDILNLTRIPPRLLVVGGGVIGCELAFVFRAFGAGVTIVEALDRLLPVDAVDEEVSRLLLREAKKRGIAVLTGKTVRNAVVGENGVRCAIGPSSYAGGAAGQSAEMEADVVLVAAGRTPDTEGLNLEAAGVATDARGWIVADAAMRTSAEDVYAVGDALGPRRPMLAHTATAEGLCAADNCLGKKAVMDYGVIPSAIFTSPEIGVVGLSEARAAGQGIRARSSLVQYRELGKSHATGELPGFFKLVCEEGSGRVLGAHIIGAHAADIVAEAALAARCGLAAADIARTVHAHPTLAEGLHEAARAWLSGGRQAGCG